MGIFFRGFILDKFTGFWIVCLSEGGVVLMKYNLYCFKLRRGLFWGRDLRYLGKFVLKFSFVNVLGVGNILFSLYMIFNFNCNKSSSFLM